MERVAQLLNWISEAEMIVDDDYDGSLGPEFAACVRYQDAVIQAYIRGFTHQAVKHHKVSKGITK
ncbi:MAG: hypothetical protein P8L68_07650 [Paracoccaceae bacterium]|nr:hypothetical protein [Paracoccaceae bacterium]